MTFNRPACTLLLLAIVPCTGCGGGGGGGSKEATAKTLDPAMAEKLADAEEVRGYEIRPPKGLKKIKPPGAPPGAAAFAWGMAARPDGTAPAFIVTVGTPPPDEPQPPVEDLLRGLVDGSLRRYEDSAAEAQQRSVMNDITFAHARWSGMDKARRKMMYGWTFAAKDGDNVLMLIVQDLEPHHEETMKLAEAMACTFRRK